MFFKRNSSKNHLHPQALAEDQQSNYAASLDQGFGIEPDPDTHMANAELFSSVAQERDANISLTHTFCANEQDVPADFNGGFGSAQDDSFNFIPQNAQAAELTIYEDQSAGDLAFNDTDDVYGSSGAHGSSSAYGDSAYDALPEGSRVVEDSFAPEYESVANSTTSFAMVDDFDLQQGEASGVGSLSARDGIEPERIGHSGNMTLAEDDDEYASASLDIASVSAEDSNSLEPQEELVQPMDEHEAAAQLIAEMMLGRNPLANLTADAPQPLDQNLDNVVSSAEHEHEHGESTESESASAASDVALEIDDADERIVNKRIQEPKHKIEIVEEQDPPKVAFLDAESEHQAALAEQREDAIVQAFVGDVDRSPSANGGPSFTLLRQQISMVNAPEKEVEPDLLSEEQEEHGNQADINDFVTGNITTLRTGTDNVSFTSVGGGTPVEEGDNTLEQPMSVVEAVLEGFEQINNAQQNYTSTLSATRITYEQPKLLPTLFKDVLRYFYVYSLAILLGVLCLVKVYQVQDTRDLTSRLNEVTFNNEELEKEWLNLLATRQNLSEHAKIRASATRQLDMVSPKTENEQVISLH